MSLPVRGAWVEMPTEIITQKGAKSLPVRGAWVEIDASLKNLLKSAGRSPCGERGLKYFLLSPLLLFAIVAPRAGSVG